METLTLNIETLLEAASFLENRTTGGGSGGSTTRAEVNAKARAKSASGFHPYAKSAGGSEKNGADDMELEGKDGGLETEMSPGDEGKERRRSGGAGTREVHNKLEKNRRAHLKECFENLKRQIPSLEDKRTSNLAILRCSLRYIQMLKRKEKEFEQEMQQLAKEKIRAQERIANLKRELAAMNIDVDVNSIVANASKNDEDTASDSTATADNESPIVSDVEDEDETDAINDKSTPAKDATLISEPHDSEIKEPQPPPQQPQLLQQLQQQQQNAQQQQAPSQPPTPPAAAATGTGADRKPHVPVTATIPAIQPPVVPTLAPKRLTVNATTPIMLAPLDHQASPHAVVAMSSARALANVPKVMTTSGNQPGLVALPAASTGMTLTPAMMAGTMITTVPPTPPAAPSTTATPVAKSATPDNSAPGATQATPTTATFKTPVAQILQQAITQRVQQQLQQARLTAQQAAPQQQQQQQQPQAQHHNPQQSQHQPQQIQTAGTAVPQATKVFAVQGNTLRHSVKPLAQLRPGMTVNHLVPSLITPGTSILATPGTLTTTQLGTLATVGKVQVGTSGATLAGLETIPAVSVSTIASSTFTTTSLSTASSTPVVQPAVTFTTMKQFLAPTTPSPQQAPQLATHAVMSLSGTQMTALSQLMAQQQQQQQQQQHVAAPHSPRAGTTVQAQQQQQPGSAATVVTTTVNIAGLAQATPGVAAATHFTQVAPGTQMVAPLSMVSPAGVQVAPVNGAISPAQLSLVNSPLLRSIGHIPIQLQQPFGLGQLVKPVVMVTMPSVVSTTPSSSATPPQPPPGTVSAVQLQLPVSHAS